MQWIKYIYVLFTLLLSSAVYGQDPQFTQFYATSLYLNPALTGTIDEARVQLNSRVQWASLPGSFVTNILTADYQLPDENSGVGVSILKDKAGTIFSQSQVNGYFSYGISLNDNWNVRAGLTVGIHQQSIDQNSLIYLDQLQSNEFTSAEEISSVDYSRSYLDIGTGLIAHSKSMWVGLSAFHLATNSSSFIDSIDSTIPVRLSIHAGNKFVLSNNKYASISEVSVSPTFNLKLQGEFKQLDVGSYIHMSPLVIGMFYRGLPIGGLKSNGRQDAVSFLVGFQEEGISIGYSYDYSIGGLKGASGGSHELSLAYRFNVLKKHQKLTSSPFPHF